MKKPVIFLAFADSRKDLPALAEERRALDDLLCVKFNVEQKDAATHDRIEQTFRGYGQQIRIFHFAGHASGDQIALLEDKEGFSKGYVKGVAKYIGRQKGVELVFLNGCSTANQVSFFQEAGIPALIATSAPINDKVARLFAELFYTNFTEGEGRKSLEIAFQEACDQMEKRVEQLTDMYTRALNFEEEQYETQFPYKLYAKTERGKSLCYLDLVPPEEIEKQGIPPQAHLLVDRHEWNDDFEEALKNVFLAGKVKPLTCLVHGNEEELPLKLCQRFREFTVKETFKKLDQVLDASRLESIEVEMPRKRDFKKPEKAMDRIKENLKEKFSLDHISITELRGLSGSTILQHVDSHLEVILLQHNIYPDEWDIEKGGSFINDYLGNFWEVQLTEQSPVVLLLFCLQYPPQKGLSGLFGKKNSKYSQAFEHLAEVLEELGPVKRTDLKMWNDTFASDDPDLTNRIFKGGKTLAMKYILPQLEAIVRQKRKH